MMVTFEHMYQNQFACGLSFACNFQWENVFCSPENQNVLSYSRTEGGQLANAKNLSQHTLLCLNLSLTKSGAEIQALEESGENRQKYRYIY